MASFVYINGGVATPPSVSFRTSGEDASDLTTYTFSTLDIGTAGANRHVAVGINATAASGGFTISSVTIGGVSATISTQAAGANRGISGIAIAAVPTGATGNVVVTFSAGVVRCAVGVWALYDLTSITAAATATSVSATSTQSLNINVVTGDILIAVAYINGDAGAQTCAWTGVTERFDTDFDAARTTGGEYLALSTETPRTVTATFSASGDRGSGVAATFR